MLRKCLWLSAVILLTLRGEAITAPVPAVNQSPLAFVPAQCPIVIQLRGVDRVRDRIKATVSAADATWGMVAASKINEWMGDFLDNRKLQGLAPSGPHFIAFVELPKPDNDNLPVALIAKTKSFADFCDGLLSEDERKTIVNDPAGYQRAEVDSHPVYMIDRQDYAVLTINPDVAKFLAKPFAGLDTKLVGEQASRFLSQDVALFVDLAQVNQQFGDNIRSTRDTMIAMMAMGGLANPAAMETARSFYSGMFQMEVDSQSLVASLDFRPEGVALHVETHVAVDSETNQFLKSQKPAPMATINCLPSGQNIYLATNGPAQAKINRFVAINAGLSASHEAKGDALVDFEAAKGRMTVAASQPPIGITVQEYEDANRAMAGTIKLLSAREAGAHFSGGILKSKSEIKPAAQNHRDIEWTSVRIVWDMDKMVAAQAGVAPADAAEQLKKVYGAEMNGWIGVSGNRLIHVQAKDWGGARTQIDKFLTGENRIGETTAFKASASMLPASTSLSYFMDAGPTLSMTAEMMLLTYKKLGVLPFQLPDQLKPVSFAPAFIGMAVTMQAERGSLDVCVPVGAIAEIKKLVDQFMVGG